jgi:hypothetical protein
LHRVDELNMKEKHAMQLVFQDMLKYAKSILTDSRLAPQPTPASLTDQQAQLIEDACLCGRLVRLNENHPDWQELHRKEFFKLMVCAADWEFSSCLHLCYQLGYDSVPGPRKSGFGNELMHYSALRLANAKSPR